MASVVENIAPQGVLMRTGIAGLDQILGGGFLHGNSILLQGSPGSGKSALGMQLIANGILQFNEPGIILSFEQFPEQLYRDALSFGWDFRKMEANGLLRIVFARRDDLHSSFAEKESQAMTLITDGAIDLKARRVLIDPISHFWRLPLPAEERRKAFIEFVMKLKGLNLTPILIGEAPPKDSAGYDEEFDVDVIVKLDHAPAATIGGPRVRGIEVVKVRGQGAMEGRHPFRIAPDGVRITPFIQAGMREEDTHPPPAKPIACSTGVDDLDNLLDGGFQSATTTMIAGMTGTGKTILAGHFMAAGFAAGEPGIFVCLNETPRQLRRNMDKRGLAFTDAQTNGKLAVVQASAAGLQLIEFYYQIKEVIESSHARRIVIDGLRDLLAAGADERERDYFLSLFSDLFRRNGLTAVYTWRVEDVTGLSSLASIPHTSMVDNILYIGLLELDSRLRKMIAAFKTRGESSDPSLRELIINTTDVRISSMFSGVSGILMGSASGHLTAEGRDFLEPLVHIREFVNSARIETPEQAKMVVDNIRNEFNVLAMKLSRHFNINNETPSPE